MTNAISECPFEWNLTSLERTKKPECLEEFFPYKTLTEVIAVCNHLKNGKRFPWMDTLVEMSPATDFCYSDSIQQDEGWFPKPRLDRNSVPKNLFCHDYRGGYLEDRFINGSNQHDAYKFINWTCVDIFVYFSHHFVTVPPPVWINASHKHGVPILGTLITEPKNGHLIWAEILESEKKAEWFAEALAFIAETHKFDGYLLNVENSLSVAQMPCLMIFIKSLKQQLVKHRKSKTYVIWYDSLTVYGELKWQNELNYNNKPFFDITDGIFVNYSWREQNLDHCRKMAGERIHDVYVGIDVFGRNMYGGGGFNTKKALQLVRQKNLSAAIFAFGWTHEKIPGVFPINDEMFWMSLHSYLNTHGTKQFPFKSSFNRGSGLKYYERGVVISDAPWFNLSRQSYQYSYLKCRTKINDYTTQGIISTIHQYLMVLNEKTDKTPEQEKLKSEKLVSLNSQLTELYGKLKVALVEYTYNDAYNGGGCIRINPSFEEGMKHVTLFDCDIEIKNDWLVKTVMKSENEKHLSDVQLYPNVYLVIQTKEGGLIKVELRHGEIESSEAGWVIRKFALAQRGRILEIGLLVNPTHRPVLLGEIAVTDR
ncbi:hypothetical protein RUM43_004752 [Polyplax serrata]|uniref:Cytosolic endo-beta-N-acetylglucosaminidase TIM barrel domain-containing protein n=1 Tax=Polyplax serrata TaxID=468196 RepID=A0AAN8SBA6_POLSC